MSNTDDGLSQGGRANNHGEAVRKAIAGHLKNLGRLREDFSRTIAEFADNKPSGLFPGSYRGAFAEGPIAHHRAVFWREFRPHFVLSVEGWPSSLALCFQSQNDGGSAENAILRLMFSLTNYCDIPSVLLLEGVELVGPERNKNKVDYIEHFVRKSPKILKVYHGLTELHAWLASGMPWPAESQVTFA